MFNKESALVKIWARNVKTDNNVDGIYAREQVPRLSNLQEMVYSILDEQ